LCGNATDLFIACFDLFADLKRQLNSGRRHLFGDEHAGGSIHG
jgi:hypothetical protein